VNGRDRITYFTRDEPDAETVGFIAPGSGKTEVQEGIRALGDEHDEIVVVATSHSVARLIAAVSEMIASADEGTESLIEAMLPRTAVVSAASAQQAQLNAEARQAFLDEFEVYDSDGVASIVGSTASNRSQAASRLVKSGRIFALADRGRRLFPAWQFSASGQPLAVITEVIAAAERLRLDGWELALWFSSESGWLDDARPVDLLDNDPDAVAEAARRTFGDVVG
jgi:hypothetical protein